MLFSSVLIAQQTTRPLLKNSPKFYEVREKYLQQLEEMEKTKPGGEEENEADNMKAKFMRWEYLMRTRVDANGNYPACNFI